MNRKAKLWLVIAVAIFLALMISLGIGIVVKIMPPIGPTGFPYKGILWGSSAIAFVGFCTILLGLRNKPSGKELPTTRPTATTAKDAGEEKKDEKKTEGKKGDKKSLSLGAQFLRIIAIMVMFALGLWPLLVVAWLWTKIPSKLIKGLVLVVAAIVMIMQGYTLFRIKHPEIDDYVGTKVTQIAKEAERTGTKPETTWWMKSSDTPTKLKPSATEHPAHQLTIVEWDKKSVIHFRYKWTTNTGKQKQVDYRWDIAHEPDYGKWTIWEGGNPTQHARWRMEWHQGQGCWIGSEEDTDGVWHSFTIYPRK